MSACIIVNSSCSGQLLEVDGRGVARRAIVVGLGAQHGGALRRVHRVPEDVAVAVGAERGGRRALALRAQPPAPAARAVRAHEP